MNLKDKASTRTNGWLSAILGGTLPDCSWQGGLRPGSWEYFGKRLDELERGCVGSGVCHSQGQQAAIPTGPASRCGLALVPGRAPSSAWPGLSCVPGHEPVPHSG